MRLKNKKTGEIMDDAQYRNFSLHDGLSFRNGDKEYYYHSLAELNADWEDAPEEPKEYWGIDYTSCRKGGIDEFTYDNDDIDEFNKSIGNYFETKEEAEKAVEKLKAWKRLKDKGIKFKESSICGSDFSVCFSLENHDDYQGSMEDFDKCFGGEE